MRLEIRVERARGALRKARVKFREFREGWIVGGHEGNAPRVGGGAQSTATAPAETRRYCPRFVQIHCNTGRGRRYVMVSPLACCVLRIACCVLRVTRHVSRVTHLRRRRPDSNRGSGICSPLPYPLATAPRWFLFVHRLTGQQKTPSSEGVGWQGRLGIGDLRLEIRWISRGGPAPLEPDLAGCLDSRGASEPATRSVRANPHRHGRAQTPPARYTRTAASWWFALAAGTWYLS